MSAADRRPLRETLRVVGWICTKELLEIRRDLRTLVMLIVLPALMYPLLMLVATKVGAEGIKKLDARELTVQVEGELPADVRDALEGVERVVVVEARENDREEPPDAIVRASVPFQSGELAPVEIVYDGATERGNTARKRLSKALRDARAEARDQRLLDRGIEPEALLVPEVRTIDKATGARKGGFLLGRMLIPILIIILVLGAYYPAVDLTVGERERQTLRTLLCAPVDPRAIAAGKLCAVALIALCAATANLAGLLLTARLGVMGLDGFQIPFRAILVAFVLLIPMAFLIGAVLMAVASLAQNQREAQTLLTPVVLVLMLPVTGAVLPGIELTPARALIPMFGPALVMREAMSGSLAWAPLLAGIAGAGGLAAASLGIAARAFTVEALVTGRVARPVRQPGPLPLFDGVLLIMAVAAAFVVIGIPLQAADLVNGLVLSQLLLFAGIPLLWATLRSTTPGHALGLTSTPSAGVVPLVVGGLLMLPTLGTLVSLPASELINEDELKAFEQMGEALLALPGPIAFLLVAVLPGVCEEITFRGAFMRALGGRPVVAVVAAAAVFALFHGSLARLVPTFVLGCLVGAVALLGRSTWAAVVLHVAHNGFAVLLATLLGLDKTVTSSPYLEMPWAIHLLVVPGFALVVWGARRALFGDAQPSAPPEPSASEGA